MSPSTTTIVSRDRRPHRFARRDRRLSLARNRSACAPRRSSERRLIDVGRRDGMRNADQRQQLARAGDDDASTDARRCSSLEPQRDRPVVHELHVHHGAELAGLDVQAASRSCG
jgi:hypothetical protein